MSIWFDSIPFQFINLTLFLSILYIKSILGVSMWKWVLASELEGNTDVTDDTRDFVKQQQSPKIFFFTWEKKVTNARTGFKRPGKP